jgi:hypothetical protein
MKKLTITALFILLIIANGSFSQQIPNGGFESWSAVSFFEEPEPYSTTNSLSYMMGDTTAVTKSTDSYFGAYSARLETMAFGSDTVTGLMMVGELRGENIIGGVPFTTRPTSLIGYVKYNLLGGDELAVICIFTRQGLPIGSIQQYYSGTQEDFTQITMPVDWVIPFLTPDSLKVVIANTSTFTSGHAGSTVYLDHFQFSNNEAFPNGEFEDWTMLNGMEPDDWTTLNYLTSTSGAPYATKTNDMHSGNWAIQIRNVTSFVGETIGYLTNGQFQGFSSIGGLGVDQNPMLVSGYYKYIPIGTDMAQAAITSYYRDVENDTVIIAEQQIVNLSPADTYTYFEIPMLYNATPLVDTINISFAAGLMENGLTPGSKLILDDITIDYYPVSVSENNLKKIEFKVYPNPAKDVIHGRLSMDDGRFYMDLTLVIYDVFGRKFGEIIIPDGQDEFEINLAAYPAGIYFAVLSRQNTYLGSAKFVVAR